MKPIQFNTEMVKAILDGRKTQTRRVIPLKNNDLIFTGFVVSSTAKNREGYCAFGKNKEQDLEFIKPHYKVGDILYVKEKCVDEYPNGFCFKEDYEEEEWNDKYLIKQYCNKLNARIFLKVTNVGVERLQDISDEDCIKEGISEVGFYPGEGFPLCSGYMIGKDDGKTALANNPQKPFGELWNSTAKDKYKWEDDPCVFIYEFERIHDV